MTAPGPSLLGRGVVVAAPASPPQPWQGAPVIAVGDEVLARPRPVVERLHTAWAGREPVVIELHVDPVTFRRPEVHAVDPWELTAEFELWLDRLHFLV